MFIRKRVLLASRICGIRTLSTGKYNFAPASSLDNFIHGCERPGAAEKYEQANSIPVDEVKQWISYIKGQNIRHVVSLLNPTEYGFYQAPGYEAQLKNAGLNVTCVNVFEEGAWPRLQESMDAAVAKKEDLVVHCSGGEGRTGAVLAAWLVHHHKISVQEAVEEVIKQAHREKVSRKPVATKITKLMEKGTLK